MACATALSSLLLDRLQYFARGLQVYIRQLRVALQGKTGDALKTDEVTTPQRENFDQPEPPPEHHSLLTEQNKIKVVALKITNNINVLIKVGWPPQPEVKRLVQCRIFPQWFIFFYPSTRISSTTRHPSRAPSPSPGSLSRSLRPSSCESRKPLVVLGSLFLCVLQLLIISVLSSPLCRPKRPAADPVVSPVSAKKQLPPQPRRGAQQIYNPPSGKYSATIGTFTYGETLLLLLLLFHLSFLSFF